MKSFKLWLEQDVDETARRQNYFNQIMQTLQATEDDLSKPLTDLPAVRSAKPENGHPQPPHSGVGAIGKLQNLLGGIVHRMSNDRSDVDTSVRAKRTMDLLTKRGTNGQVQPNLYLQDFLRELFGNDFHAKYVDGQGSQDRKPTPPPMGPPPQPTNTTPEPAMPPNQGMPQPPPGGLQFT